MIGAVCYVLLVVLAVFFCRIGWKRQLQQEVTKTSNPFDIEKISVVIPFRNEATNLPQLLQSIRQLSSFPKEFIFINDHSSDLSCECFQAFDFPFQLIHLSDNLYGKKQALRKGIEAATGEYILTWDADITIPNTYFEVLKETQQAELSILPITMIGNNTSSYLAELDYYYLPVLNASCSAFLPPFCASGANLLFHNQAFKAVDSFQAHQHILSGDDIFLLQDFKNNKRTIQIITQKELTVKTATPSNLKAIFQQRLRWISKTSAVNDRTATLIAMFGLLYHIGGWVVIAFVPKTFFLILFTKIIADWYVFTPYLRRINRSKIATYIPLFSIIYPFYLLTILLLLPFVEIQWKNRKIKD